MLAIKVLEGIEILLLELANSLGGQTSASIDWRLLLMRNTIQRLMHFCRVVLLGSI